MTQHQALSEAFIELLRQLLSAEQLSGRAFSKAIANAHAPELKRSLESLVSARKHQVLRLEQVFNTIGKSARGKMCAGMRALTSEMQLIASRFENTPANDAVLIECAQTIGHYEICKYGTLVNWAGLLGNGKAARHLCESLREKEKADKEFSQLAQLLNMKPEGVS